MSTTHPTLRALLHSAGLRATEQRLAVLAALEAGPGPCSASWLQEHLRGVCDRPTVYRNLAVLSAAGLIDEVGRACGQTWYRRSGQHGAGAVFVCVLCRHARSVEVRLASPEVRWHRALAQASTFFTGICPECAPQEEHP